MATPPISLSDAARFEKHIEHVPFTDCWLWSASTSGTRVKYGMFGLGRKVYKAHRVAWWIHRGEIPEGKHIDHLCCMPICVNPSHLEPVSQRENNARTNERGRNGNIAKTRCPQGHEYTESTTYLNNGRRVCNICMRAHRAKWRAKKKT